jgi:aryl-alcohol dehydrogenase-like predicted oxidoreductase
MLLTTKGGITRGPGESWGRDASPQALRRACEQSLRALGVDTIDLYQLHRLDPSIPVADQVGGLLALQQDGLVRMVGLSNVTAAELDVACRGGGPPRGARKPGRRSRRRLGAERVLPALPRRRRRAGHLRRGGVAFLPWSPLGGAGEASEVGSRYAPIGAIAAAHGVSPQRVVLAWLLALSPTVVPIPGSTRSETVRDSLGALDVVLSSEESDRIAATEGEPDSMYPDDQPRPPLR